MMGDSTFSVSNWMGGGLRCISGTMGTAGISICGSAEMKVGRTTLSCKVACEEGVVWRVRCLGGDLGFCKIWDAGAIVEVRLCWRLKGGGGVDWTFCPFDCLLWDEREDLGFVPGEEGFDGVRVDAALKLAKEDLFINAGLSGVEGIDPPMRRLAMDAVSD